MRKKKNKKTVADTGYKKVDRKEKKKKEKQEEKRRQKKLSVQQSIAYKEMGRDGICRVQGKTYSKCIRFYDINYQLAQNEDKNAIFENWCDFLNYFDSSIHFQLSFINHKSSMKEFEQVIRIRPQEDAFDDVRMEYAKMLKQQLAKGNNGLVKSKYITFSIEADNIREAKPKLERIESDILNNFKILNQFALYRVDQNTDGKVLWHLPYQEASRQNVPIRVEYYRKMSIQAMQENEKVTDVWKRIKEKCEVSDVLVLNQNGEISCYYLDEEYPQYIAGFIRLNTSGALVTIDTENYQIDGKKGNWIATDSIILDGKQFYLMEHQEYRNQAAAVVLDAYGKMIVEECRNGFDEETKQKIQSYIQQMNMPDPVRQVRHQQKVRLEYYQKFYENGTFERSRESGIEANYDMVDGLVNNQKKQTDEKETARTHQKGERQTERSQIIVPVKLKKRRSVIKRLREKQIAIAVKSGKPIPKYLDQELERRRG